MSQSPPAVLHVACMPFPTAQGTQAAIRHMLDAAAAAGRSAHLLTYGHSAYPSTEGFTVHRLRNFGVGRSLRSGPSVGKMLLNAAMILKVRSLQRRLRPRAFVAHHIEAALSLRAAGAAPVIYVAHTSLETELPFYFSRAHGLLQRAGRFADAGACHGADACAAVSPMLARILSEQTGADVTHLPIPWSIARRIDPLERRKARDMFRLADDVPVVLYAGNLDAYQGLDDVLVAMRSIVKQASSTKLIIATASCEQNLRARARLLAIDGALSFAPLGTEQERRLVYAAADVVVVPRKAKGGLPVKLLDALSRGVAAVATKRATTELSIGRACHIVRDDSPHAIATGTLRLLRDPDERQSLADQGLAYIDKEHSAARFLNAYDALIAGATRKQAVPPEQDGRAPQVEQTHRQCTNSELNVQSSAAPPQTRTPLETR